MAAQRGRGVPPRFSSPAPEDTLRCQRSWEHPPVLTGPSPFSHGREACRSFPVSKQCHDSEFENSAI